MFRTTRYIIFVVVFHLPIYSVVSTHFQATCGPAAAAMSGILLTTKRAPSAGHPGTTTEGTLMTVTAKRAATTTRDSGSIASNVPKQLLETPQVLVRVNLMKYCWPICLHIFYYQHY
jgi:hypothetical protein